MPLTIPPVSSAPMYARNRATGETYLVGGAGSGSSEVEVDAVQPTSDWELWADTSAVGLIPSSLRIARGTIPLESYGLVPSGSAITTLITFPPGLFTAKPHLTATFEAWQGHQLPGLDETPSSGFQAVVTCSAIYADSADVIIYFPAGYTLSASQNINWMAVQ